MRVGTRRLLALTIPSPLRQYERGSLGNAAQLVLMEAPHAQPARGPGGRGDGRDLVADGPGRRAGVGRGVVRPPARLRRRPRRRRDRADRRQTREDPAGRARGPRALDTLRGAAFDEVRRDVAQQLGRLVFPGFITPTGAGRLADVERYLRGADWRLERLHKAAAVDRDRMRAIQELENLYRRRLEDLPAGRSADGELSEVPWLLEELRMSQFAQAIGSKGQVSSRKIRRILDEAR